MYAGYSCKLNDSASESDEVHTLELPLLIFIALSTAWCNLSLWNRTAQSQLKFLSGGWDPVPILVEGRGSLV